MDHRFDLVIRSGTIFDGTGTKPRDADVAISNGRIVTTAMIGNCQH